MAGQSFFYPGYIAPKPTEQFGDPSAATGAADKQNNDYNSIMAQYKTVTSGSNPVTAPTVSSVNINPTTTPYTQSADVTKSLSNLSSLADTGGYSDADIANIRARDTSPIRSIYSNAQQNVERAKALAGGYSPNFNATQAKMARDESQQISDVTTAANAGIAQSVAANKISAATPYANTAATANAAQTAADKANADIINQINETNAANKLSTDTGNANRVLSADTSNRSNILAGIQGQQGLYGTTPALTKTFGDQVIQAGDLGLSQQQLNDQRRRDALSLAGVVG